MENVSFSDRAQSMTDRLGQVQHRLFDRLHRAYRSCNPTVVWASTALLCCVEIFLRRPGALLYAQPWAEDGGVFISQGLRYGFQSVLLPYNGYLHLIPRLVSLLAISVSQWNGSGIVLVPLIMNSTAIVLAAMAVATIVTPSFDWLMPRKYRVLLAIGLLAAPYSPSIFGTITDIQWFLGIYQFFWVWRILGTGRGPQSVWTLIALACAGLSGPLGGILALAFVGTTAVQVRALSAHRLHASDHPEGPSQRPARDSTSPSRLILWQTLAICLGPAIESIIALPVRASQGPILNGMSVWLALEAIMRSTLEGAFARVILPEFPTVVNLVGSFPVLLVGCAILSLIVALWMSSGRSRELLIPIGYLITYELLTEVGRNWPAQYLNTPYIDFNVRSDFIPYAVVFTTLVLGLVRLKQRRGSRAGTDSTDGSARGLPVIFFSLSGAPRINWRQLALASAMMVLALVAIVDALYFQLPAYGNFNWPKEVASYSPGGHLMCTAISLPGLPWQTRFPCNIRELSDIPLQINTPAGWVATLVGMPSRLAPLSNEFEVSQSIQGVGAEVNVLSARRDGTATLILRRGLGLSGPIIGERVFQVAGGEWLLLSLKRPAPPGQYTLEMTAARGVGWWEDLPGTAPGVQSLSGRARQPGIFDMEYLMLNGPYTVPKQITCPC